MKLVSNFLQIQKLSSNPFDLNKDDSEERKLLFARLFKLSEIVANLLRFILFPIDIPPSKNSLLIISCFIGVTLVAREGREQAAVPVRTKRILA